MGDVGLCMNEDGGRKEVQHFRFPLIRFTGKWFTAAPGGHMAELQQLQSETAGCLIQLLKALFLLCLSLALIRIFYELSITTVPPYGFFSRANPYIFDQLWMFEHFHLKWEGAMFLAVFTAFIAIRVW
ncbi:hypothetical protein AMECASPLE_010235 [Ameca splendens]|uniref:Uncharacterized protein n=1 Tax=Ameca splendens TaxID=208324 RepID=A0ABV0XDG9_9TELE